VCRELEDEGLERGDRVVPFPVVGAFEPEGEHLVGAQTGEAQAARGTCERACERQHEAGQA
jgi:hypothetical protein